MPSPGCVRRPPILFAAVEFLVANVAAPQTIWRWRQRWCQAIHVIATIAVIAEQQLIVVVGCAANRTVFAFDALPAISFHGDDHVRCELQTRRMTRSATVRARYQIFGRIRFSIFTWIAQAEITVRRWWCFASFVRLTNDAQTFVFFFWTTDIRMGHFIWTGVHWIAHRRRIDIRQHRRLQLLLLLLLL